MIENLKKMITSMNYRNDFDDKSYINYSFLNTMLKDIYDIAKDPIEISINIFKNKNKKNEEKIGSGTINIDKNIFNADIKLNKLLNKKLNRLKKIRYKKHFNLYNTKINNALNYFKKYDKKKEILSNEANTKDNNSYNTILDGKTGNFNMGVEEELNKIPHVEEDEYSDESNIEEEEESESEDEEKAFKKKKYEEDKGYFADVENLKTSLQTKMYPKKTNLFTNNEGMFIPIKENNFFLKKKRNLIDSI